MADNKFEKKEKGDPRKKFKTCPKCKRQTNLMICVCGEVLYKKHG